MQRTAAKQQYVQVSAHEMVFEEELAHLKQEQVTVVVTLGKKLIAKLPLDGKSVAKVPLASKPSSETINLVALDDQEQYVGSVSIPQQIMMNGKPGLYKQWITLFENDDDDEYDGALGLQDDEDPRILFTFNTKQDDPARKTAADRKALTKRSPDRKAPASKVNLDTPAAPTQKNNFASPRANANNNVQRQNTSGSTAAAAKKPTAPVKTATTVQKSPTTTTSKAPAARAQPAAKTAPAASTSAARSGRTQQQKQPAPAAKPEPVPQEPEGFTAPELRQVKLVDVEQEVDQSNDRQYDINFLKDLLRRKIDTLSDNVSAMQEQNYAIEDNMLERLKVLKSFNEDMSSVSKNVEKENQDMRKELDDRRQAHEDYFKNDQELPELEHKLKDCTEQVEELRTKSEKVSEETKVLVAEHAARLTSIVNRETEVDRTKLVDQIKTRTENERQRQDCVDSIRDRLRDVQTNQGIYSNKTNEFQTLLVDQAKENSRLQVQITRLNNELLNLDSEQAISEAKVTRFENEKEYLELEISEYQKIIEDRQENGEHQYTEMRDHITVQEDKIVETADELNNYQNRENIHKKREGEDLQEDYERLSKNNRDALKEQDLQTAFNDFKREIDVRKTTREQLLLVHQQLETRISENQAQRDEVKNKMEEVEALCSTITEKDKQLLLDLMNLQDQINQKRVKEEGWNADEKNVSSILLSNTRHEVSKNIMQTRDELSSNNDKDQNETNKLKKLLDKFHDRYNKQKQDLEDKEKQLADRKTELENTMAEVKSLQKDLKTAQATTRSENKVYQEKLAKLANFDDELDFYEQSVEDADSTIKELQELLHAKEADCDELRKKVGGVNTNVKKPVFKKQKPYKVAKGDQVDALLADWLANNECLVPIIRMGGGYYMFGTKKVYAKILNNKLVIRVGGGYMAIGEFVATYQEAELKKVNALPEEQREALWRGELIQVAGDKGGAAPSGRRSSVMASPTARRGSAINR